MCVAFVFLFLLLSYKFAGRARAQDASSSFALMYELRAIATLQMCAIYIYILYSKHTIHSHTCGVVHTCVCVCLHILESKYRNMQLCNLHAECAFLVVSQRTVSRQNCTAATTCLGRLITALLRFTQFVFKCRFNGAGFSSNFFNREHLS